jgi:hypothetical protein
LRGDDDGADGSSSRSTGDGGSGTSSSSGGASSGASSSGSSDGDGGVDANKPPRCDPNKPFVKEMKLLEGS